MIQDLTNAYGEGNSETIQKSQEKSNQNDVSDVINHGNDNNGNDHDNAKDKDVLRSTVQTKTNQSDAAFAMGIQGSLATSGNSVDTIQDGGLEMGNDSYDNDDVYIADPKELRNTGQYRLWGKQIGGTFPTSCVVGPDYVYLIFTFILVIAPTLVIFILVAPNIHAAIILPGVITMLLTLIFLSLTAFSDPGIIPKLPKNYVHRDIDPDTLICPYCNVPRPRNCYHCVRCDACIINLDHHCPVENHKILGNKQMNKKKSDSVVLDKRQ